MPARAPDPIRVGLTAVIVAVTEEVPRILTVEPGGGAEGPESLPFGRLDPAGHRTLERGLRSWVLDQTGLGLGYVEQLYTFGDRDRDPRSAEGGARTLSVAYLALVREGGVGQGAGARWRGWYEYFPWEDWRAGRPALIDREIAPALERWAGTAASPLREVRRERIDITFGLGGARWDDERVLHRYELLFEAGLVREALGGAGGYGRPLHLDNRRILATALGRLRGKIKYRPVVFELLPPTFTLFQLQRTVEALAGQRLHKQNFRRLVERGGLVEGTGRFDAHTGGRPAELFRFRREVLRERPAPGVGLPGART